MTSDDDIKHHGAAEARGLLRVHDHSRLLREWHSTRTTTRFRNPNSSIATVPNAEVVSATAKSIPTATIGPRLRHAMPYRVRHDLAHVPTSPAISFLVSRTSLGDVGEGGN